MKTSNNLFKSCLLAWFLLSQLILAVNVKPCSVELELPDSIPVNLDDDNENEEWDKDDTPMLDEEGNPVGDDDLKACEVSIEADPQHSGTLTITFEEGSDKVGGVAWMDDTKQEEHPLEWDVVDGQLDESVPATFYLEGLEHSDDWDDVELKATLDVEAEGNSCTSEDEKTTTVVEVDLDVDSENDNEYEFAGFSDFEDKIEFSNEGENGELRPGKLVLCTSYSNFDGDEVLDFADGFNLDIGSASIDEVANVSSNLKFVPVQIELKEPFDPSSAKILFTYNFSKPEISSNGIKLSGTGSEEDPYLLELNKAGMRLWTKDAVSRDSGENVPSGNYIPAEEELNWSDIATDSGSRIAEIYLEYVDKDIPEAGGREKISILVTENDAEYEDQVNVTLLPADLDIDSDNTNGSEMPDRDATEEVNENIDDESLIKPESPGKILMVNDGDLDSDLVPDFADGLDVFEEDGIKLPEDVEDRTEVTKLVPLVLQLSKLSDNWEDVRVRFKYDDSDPSQIDRFGGPENYEYEPAEGALRLWKKDVDGKQFEDDPEGEPIRKVAQVSEEGDFIAADQPYKATDIGFDENRNAVNLYIEALTESSLIRDQKIIVEVDFDGDGPIEYREVDKIDCTVINIQLVEVDENNNTEPVRSIETSTPTPELKLSQVKILDAVPSADGTQIMGRISLAGTIKSMVCDFTKPEDGGTINEVKVYMNGSDDPVATIAAAVTKSSDPNSLLKPYPFSASFDQTLEDIPLLEGTNTIRVEATEQVDEVVGYAEYSVDVEGSSAFAANNGGNGGGAAYASLELGFDGALDLEAVDSLEITFATPGGSVSDVELTETETGSAIFVSQDESLTLRILSQANAFDPDSKDLVSVTVTHTTFAPSAYTFHQLLETGNGTLVFQQTLVSDEDAWQAEDYQGFTFRPGASIMVASSEPGSMSPYMLRIRGPEDLLEFIDTIVTADGPRKVEKSDIDGEYYIKMKNSPPAVYLWKAWQIGNDDNLDNEEKMLALLDLLAEGLDDQVQYKIGLVHGLYDGGADMVEGIYDLLKFVMESNLKWSPPALVIRWANGDEFKAEKQFFSTSWETSKKLGNLWLMLAGNQVDLYTALLAGDDEQLNAVLAELGDKYGDAIIAAAEVMEALGEELANLSPRQRGYFEGRASFEILTLYFSWTKVAQGAKLTKVNFLNKLKTTKFFKTPKGQAAFDKLLAQGDYLTRLANTKMCFPAGTPVASQHGKKAIEHIRPDDLVWSRCPDTGVVALKPVLQVFVTHPDRLFHLVTRSGMSSGEDGDEARHSISTTGEHPFWVVEKQAFVAASELNPGDTFLTRERKYETLATARIEHAPPGETFTTYNFEVADFHTYFAGTMEIWVHNLGKGEACERIFSIYDRFKTKFSKTPEEAWKKVEYALFRNGKLDANAMGAGLEEALKKDVFPTRTEAIWTVGPMDNSGANMLGHWTKHAADFPDVDNAIGYIKKAHSFVDDFPTGNPGFHTWNHPTQPLQFYINKTTREKAIKMTGPFRGRNETGALQTYHKHNVGKNFEQWARSNGFPSSQQW